MSKEDWNIATLTKGNSYRANMILQVNGMAHKFLPLPIVLMKYQLIWLREAVHEMESEEQR